MPRITPEQQAEIDSLRAASSSTLRPTSAALEAILYNAIPILDHGMIRVIDYMGDDSAIIQAARVSYGRGTRKTQEDRALIQYLIRHWHTTPFEMAEIKFHVKLPIFVARQWIRHRMASVNEYSARYSVLDKEFYIPAPENLAAQSASNKQGRGSVLTGEEADKVLNLLKSDAERVYDNYTSMLNDDGTGNPINETSQGLARELARMNLSLNFYTQWYWKTDLHNLMGFLRLRADSHAQYEIRVYAEAMLEIMKQWVPLTFEAFKEHRLDGAHLSATGINVVRRMLAGEAVTQPSSGLTTREWTELQAVIRGGADGS